MIQELEYNSNSGGLIKISRNPKRGILIFTVFPRLQKMSPFVPQTPLSRLDG